MEAAGGRQVTHVEHHVADLGRGLGEEVGHLAPDHERDDLVHAGLGDALRADVLTVAHDGDGVAQVEDLVEAVGDEDQGAALVAQAAGDGEEAVHLDTGQGGGGLVHDEQRGVERDGLGDLEDLLVGDREAAGRATRVDRDAEPLEEGGSLGVHPVPVDAARGADRLATHEDVLGDVEVGEERRLLVDHRHPGGLGLRRRGEVGVPAQQAEDAGVAAVDAGDDLDQRRLARTVLADEGVDGARLDPEGARAQGGHRTEGLGDVLEDQRRLRHHHS